MELTAETLSELQRALRSNPMGGLDNRRQPRVGLRLKARLTASAGKAPIMVWVRDVSVGGLGFTSSQAFKECERVSLLLDGDPPKIIACEVMHSRRAGSGVYQTGVRFVAELN